ncbi:hypothetical protein ACHAO8_003842 [Botrytis cinerea]
MFSGTSSLTLLLRFAEIFGTVICTLVINSRKWPPFIQKSDSKTPSGSNQNGQYDSTSDLKLHPYNVLKDDASATRSVGQRKAELATESKPNLLKRRAEHLENRQG